MREHRALAILRMLLRIPAYRANERIVSDALDRYALGGLREELRADIDALERLALLRTEAHERLLIVALTDRGREVAEGRRVVDGVLRPGPEEPY